MDLKILPCLCLGFVLVRAAGTVPPPALARTGLALGVALGLLEGVRYAVASLPLTTMTMVLWLIGVVAWPAWIAVGAGLASAASPERTLRYRTAALGMALLGGVVARVAMP